MSKKQLALFLVVAIVVLIALFAPKETTTTQKAQPTANTVAKVMPNIENESDCGILQAIFDNAENAGDGARDKGDVDLARAFTDAMRRADDRMREVGCY